MQSKKRKTGIFRLLAILAFTWLIVHLVYITIDGLRDHKGSADIAVVLGNKVNGDSSLSPVLQGRVDKAWLLFRQGRVQRIMVSGGRGKKDDNVPEGLAMKRYLLQKGVPAAAIIEDNDGENTYLTSRNFRAVKDSLHLSSVIVVSSFYHITRTKYIFRKQGYNNVYSASSDVFFANDIIGLLREFPALYKYMFYY
jgi:vancomycin permeability regulator SanA